MNLFLVQGAYASPQYGGGRARGSPGGGGSPHSHMAASPQVPSPQGQTLDLSVSRLPHGSVPHAILVKQPTNQPPPIVHYRLLQKLLPTH